MLRGMVYDLPSPANISYKWNLGSLLGAVLGLQVFTGLVISLHFKSKASLAFEVVLNITREIKEG